MLHFIFMNDSASSVGTSFPSLSASCVKTGLLSFQVYDVRDTWTCSMYVVCIGKVFEVLRESQ